MNKIFSNNDFEVISDINHKSQTLGIIIPCFGKTDDLVIRTIESAIKTGLNIVFVYENSNEWNYDWVIKQYFNKISIIKATNQSFKKAAKMLIASKFVNSQYFICLDADDELFKNKTLKIEKILSNLSGDYFVRTKAYFNFENKFLNLFAGPYQKITKGYNPTFKQTFENWGSIYKTSVFNNISNIANIELLSLPFDDLVLGMYYINFSNIKFLNININHYKYYVEKDATRSFERIKNLSFQHMLNFINYFEIIDINGEVNYLFLHLVKKWVNLNKPSKNEILSIEKIINSKKGNTITELKHFIENYHEKF